MFEDAKLQNFWKGQNAWHMVVVVDYNEIITFDFTPIHVYALEWL